MKFIPFSETTPEGFNCKIYSKEVEQAYNPIDTAKWTIRARQVNKPKPHCFVSNGSWHSVTLHDTLPPLFSIYIRELK
jgi:hypothetical protein